MMASWYHSGSAALPGRFTMGAGRSGRAAMPSPATWALAPSFTARARGERGGHFGKFVHALPSFLTEDSLKYTSALSACSAVNPLARILGKALPRIYGGPLRNR